jgi:4-carboxymuconolactone decarboxylase
MADQPSDKFQAGMAVRRQVLGDAYVDASLSKMDEFSRDLQTIITEHAWGDIWTREGLSLKQRSLINIALLSALNRPHELELHLRGAINNGCTITEIREALLQTAVYAGLPSGLDSFRVARRVFEEMGVDTSRP